MPEARLDESGSGKYPASDGWFVVNVRDTVWMTSDTSGSVCPFEGREFWFPQVGIKLRVLEPGQPNALYHSESQQEAFLVLSGECRLLVEVKSGCSGHGTSFTVLRGPSTSSWARATGRACS